MKVLVYSAITQGYDSIKPGRDFWFIDPTYIDSPEPARRAKYPKVMLHHILPGVEYSVWLDGSIRIGPTLRPSDLIERYLTDGCDMAVMKHPERDCLFEEARACVKLAKDSPATLARQTVQYDFEGHPKHWGLSETGVMIRRHTPEVNAFCDAWWREIERHSRRDQVSFPYVQRRMGLRVRQIEGRPFFTVEPHTVKPGRVTAFRGRFG